jgi:hypothetical protein
MGKVDPGATGPGATGRDRTSSRAAPCDQFINLCEDHGACDPDCTQPPPLTGGYTDIPCTDSAQCPAGSGQECLSNDTEHDSWCAGECLADSDCTSDGCCLGRGRRGGLLLPSALLRHTLNRSSDHTR